MGNLKFQESSYEKFSDTFEKSVTAFKNNNGIFKLIDAGKLERKHYHALLKAIYQQMHVAGGSGLALAGALADNRYTSFRSYMIKHAQDENMYNHLIAEDLNTSGYTGPHPAEDFPDLATEACRSFAMYYALKHPVESLAIYYFFEAVSSRFGLDYGMRAAQQAGLNNESLKFIGSHYTDDQKHVNETLEVLKQQNFTPQQWALCEHAVRTISHLYTEMYNQAAR